MILDTFFNDKKGLMLKKLLEFSSDNHKVIANNLVNVETPGYTAKKLEFEKEFKNALKSGDKKSIEAVQSIIVNNLDNPYRMDMNNVDAEKEMIALEENRIRYDLVGTLLKKHLSKWQDIFKGN